MKEWFNKIESEEVKLARAEVERAKTYLEVTKHNLQVAKKASALDLKLDMVEKTISALTKSKKK